MPDSANGSQYLADEAAAILESISDAFYAVTADWKIAYANKRAEPILGMDRQQLIGRDLWELYPALEASEFGIAYRKAMRDGAAAQLTAYYPAHGKWYEVRIAPMAPGLSFYLRDVTAQVNLEQALRERERDLQMLADSIPQIVWIVEASGQAVYFNRQWVAYTDVPITWTTPANVAGDFVHPEDRAATMAAWDAAYEHGGNFQVEHRIRSKTGEYRWFLVLAEPYRNAAGEIERWFGTSTDIHEQKLAKMALAESELRFRALVNATSDVIYRMSPDWKYMHELDGRGFLKTTTGLAEYRMEEYVHPDDLEMGRKAIAHAIETKSIFALEHRVLRADGSYGWTYSKAVPILDDEGEIREWVGMASDITERKATEKQLTEASRHKDEFLAMLAHELRNPLSPIKAAAQLLQRPPLGEERILQTSRIIERQVVHMTNLVDELLDVSRVSRNLVELERAPLDIRQVVGDAVEQVTPLMQARRHHLDIHLGPESAVVAGDQKRLVQTIANLLNNAGKFTHEGGRIRLSVNVLDAQMLVEVADNGIGMSPHTAEHAFDLFAQAERSADRSQGGLGLGLALVKRLVELHGGTVQCRSAGLGKGSTFTVCLPRLAVRDPIGTPPDGQAVPGKHADALRILVVDDNEDAAGTLAMLLETMGHRVAVEHGSRQALERAVKDVPRVCLLDIGLPEMDGNELATQLRARPETAGAVLIAVTGYGQESDRRKSIGSGFDHHLVKPVDIDKLAAILAEVNP